MKSAGSAPDSASRLRSAERALNVRLVGQDKKKLEFSLIISLASLALSVVAAFVTLVAWLRGPELDVSTPDTISFYSEGGKSRGILKTAVRLTIINTAAAPYGDALMRAHVRLHEDSRAWKEEATARIALPDRASVRDLDCPFGSQCVEPSTDDFTASVRRFISVEEAFEPITVPGGAAQTVTLVFPVVERRCLGGDAVCKNTGLFVDEVKRQLRPNMDVKITLQFLREGELSVICRLQGTQPSWLLKHGFLTRRCALEENG